MAQLLGSVALVSRTWSRATSGRKMAKANACPLARIHGKKTIVAPYITFDYALSWIAQNGRITHSTESLEGGDANQC